MSVKPFLEDANAEVWAETVLKEALQLPNNPRKESTGGYLTVLDQSNRQVLHVMKIGEIPKDHDKDYGTKDRKYLDFSPEKALRVAYSSSIISSWETRDGKKKFGGAIRGTNYIWSYSGSHELIDEAISLLVAMELGDIQLENAEKIANISGNEFFRPLYERTR